MIVSKYERKVYYRSEQNDLGDIRKNSKGPGVLVFSIETFLFRIFLWVLSNTC